MKWILVITFAITAYGTEDFNMGRDVLSMKWVAGETLVYDCKDQHWVCASTAMAQDCKTGHKEEWAKGSHYFSCVVGESFATRSECHAQQKKALSFGFYPRFCVHPAVRSRSIVFQ